MDQEVEAKLKIPAAMGTILSKGIVAIPLRPRPKGCFYFWGSHKRFYKLSRAGFCGREGRTSSFSDSLETSLNCER